MRDLLAFVLLRHRIGISVTLAAFLLDQITKLLVIRTLAVGESWPEDGFFHLTHLANFGSTLDLFSGHSTVLIAGSVAGICALFALYWPRPETGVRTQVTFGLMLAGAVGNIADRVVFGHVTDFIDIVPWFIFNVADVAILMGLIGFAWDIRDVTDRFLSWFSRRSQSPAGIVPSGRDDGSRVL